jgi:hypothetical protein
MNTEEKYVFYVTIKNLVEYIRLFNKIILMHQSEFSDALNQFGVHIYQKKDYPISKALFWVSYQLGNFQAFRNYLCIKS